MAMRSIPDIQRQRPNMFAAPNRATSSLSSLKSAVETRRLGPDQVNGAPRAPDPTVQAALNPTGGAPATTEATMDAIIAEYNSWVTQQLSRGATPEQIAASPTYQVYSQRLQAATDRIPAPQTQPAAVTASDPGYQQWVSQQYQNINFDPFNGNMTMPDISLDTYNATRPATANPATPPPAPTTLPPPGTTGTPGTPGTPPADIVPAPFTPITDNRPDSGLNTNPYTPPTGRTGGDQSTRMQDAINAYTQNRRGIVEKGSVPGFDMRATYDGVIPNTLDHMTGAQPYSPGALPTDIAPPKWGQEVRPDAGLDTSNPNTRNQSGVPVPVYREDNRPDSNLDTSNPNTRTNPNPVGPAGPNPGGFKAERPDSNLDTSNPNVAKMTSTPSTGMGASIGSSQPPPASSDSSKSSLTSIKSDPADTAPQKPMVSDSRVSASDPYGRGITKDGVTLY